MRLPSLADAISETDNCAIITIEVTTNSKRDVFPAGFNEWRTTIGCHVTAPAVEGRANKALISLIAKTFHLPKSAVWIQSGAASPVKRITIAGTTKEDLLLCVQSMI
ncbi:MAG: DUF167 domain-containing protein [Methanoregula sp.]|nr:DUF167 domain-containing protein [Methanoregula sp.]